MITSGKETDNATASMQISTTLRTKISNMLNKIFNKFKRDNKNSQFDIEMKLYKPFVKEFNKLRREYGVEFELLNGLGNSNLNFSEFIDNFIDSNSVADVSIDANANSNTHDICTMIGDMTKPHLKLLAFNKIFYEITKKYGEEKAKSWLRHEWTGCFYLHNASTSTSKSYCFAYDLDQIAEKGLFFINKFKTGAPKHLTTFNDHVLEFISWASNRTSGAVGLPSYLVYSWYFWNKDKNDGFYLKDPEYYRRQCFQKFIYDLNQPYLRVTECAFTNITIMDHEYLEELFGGRVFPDGTMAIDHIDEIIEHQKVFMEVVSETRKITMMTFPVLTYSLLFQNGKFVDEPFARWCSDHNLDWYDSNFYVGSDVTSLSNCCRLISDTSKLDAFINSIGGTSLSIGSVQVNTINLRRIALEVNGDEDKYIELLTERVNECMMVLDVCRHIIQRNIEKGLLPNYTNKLIDLEKQYCTIGITAMYETMNDFGYIDIDELGNRSYSEKALAFSKRIMNTINSIKDNTNFDYSFNVECVPAERANVILCKKDAALYDKSGEYFMYSNQWIPLMEKCTLQEKVKLGSLLDKECGGGQISHITIDGRFSSADQAWNLLNQIAKAGVIYFAYNTKISVCKSEHAFYGDTCPECGEPVYDTYTRVVGFLTPISTWSKERKQEFPLRKAFDVNQSFDLVSKNDLM